MATSTSHALSMLANNSIKNPIDVRTGRIASLTKPLYASDNSNGVGIYHTREAGIKIKISPNGDTVTEYTSDPVSGLAQDDLSAQLHSLSNEEFYNKLSKMKEHQKRTLDKCERLYMEKKALEDKYACPRTIWNDEDIDIDTGTMIVNGTVLGCDRGNRIEHNEYLPIKSYDNICDLSSKPPVVPNQVRPPSRQGKRPGKTSLTDNVSPPVQWVSVKSRSLDGYGGQNLVDVEDEYLTDEEIGGYMSDNISSMNIDPRTIIRREEVTTPSKLELQRIESMWDDFAINDYAPRQRPSSAPSARRTEKQKKVSEWRHRLTIPQPFNMTLREGAKNKEKNATQIQVENERLQKEQEEELECQKKFKAKPVPAHVYLPLFNEINEKSEAKRRYVKQYCQELLKSQEKPFKFMKREEYKLNQRRNSEPTIHVSRNKSKENKKFKAKPVPSFVYEDSVVKKQMEDEEYRKLRICMRSEELLKEASLPPSMAAREKIKQQKIQESKRQAKARKQFRPKIHRHIPDYDGMYKKFQRELARRKTDIKQTTVQPFRLETARMHTDTDKILQDIARDEAVLIENRWPYRTPRARTPTNTPRSKAVYYTPMDSFPPKMTRASDTRNSSIRNSIERQREESKQQIEEERHRRIREMKLRKSITEKAGDKNQHTQSIRDRLRRFKEDERTREEDYLSEMNAIKERVEQQPMLFERQQKMSAKNKAEKKFANTLKNVGLDEEFIYSKSSVPTSVQDDDDDEYVADETYVKSSSHYTDSFEED